MPRCFWCNTDPQNERHATWCPHFRNPFTFNNPMRVPMRISIDAYEFTLQPGESKTIEHMNGRERLAITILMPDTFVTKPITIDFSEPFP